jgi:hypothetical protein
MCKTGQHWWHMGWGHVCNIGSAIWATKDPHRASIDPQLESLNPHWESLNPHSNPVWRTLDPQWELLDPHCLGTTESTLGITGSTLGSRLEITGFTVGITGSTLGITGFTLWITESILGITGSILGITGSTLGSRLEITGSPVGSTGSTLWIIESTLGITATGSTRWIFKMLQMNGMTKVHCLHCECDSTLDKSFFQCQPGTQHWIIYHRAIYDVTVCEVKSILDFSFNSMFPDYSISASNMEIIRWPITGPYTSRNTKISQGCVDLIINLAVT